MYERISPLSNTELTGMPLGAIVCRNDKKLPLLHKDLRKAMFLEGTTYDVSTIHNRILRDATRLPSFVYRIEETKEKRVELAKGDALLSHDRPPSSWYYPYYLSWFLDGTSVLFETYDNPLGEVSRAKELFEECMKTIESVTGFRPLVVKIPPLSHELLYCNRHFLWRHHALSQLQETAERFESNDTVSLFNEIAQTITRFR